MLLLVMLGMSITCLAQVQLPEPEVGKPCPDYMLNDIAFYSKKKANLSDFKGKWLILDFWAMNCSSCIASFPEVSTTQSLLRDSLQYLMITYDDPKKENRTIYNRYHKNLKLNMPCAFDGTTPDNGIFNQFNIAFLPHAVVIDPKGIVRAVTSKVNIIKLKDLMAGRPVTFRKPSFAREKPDYVPVKYDRSRPLGVNNNVLADSDFIYRSQLSPWKPGYPVDGDEQFIYPTVWDKVYHNKGRFQTLGCPLEYIYWIAYTGRMPTQIDGRNGLSNLVGEIWPKPLLEIKDSSLFEHDSATGKNLFCYSMVVPREKATEALMKDVMQNDLRHYFGYHVVIEERDMPYLRMIAKEGAAAMLQSRMTVDTIVATSKGSWQGAEYKNIPFKDFFRLVKIYIGLSDANDMPVIDETGIEGNIAINVEWFKNDINSVRKALQKYGLDIVRGEKRMKVLVIKDE